MNFKVGDLVLLKSGGPLMTVYNVTNEMVDCVWFTSNSAVTPSTYSFQTGALKAAQ